MSEDVTTEAPAQESEVNWQEKAQEVLAQSRKWEQRAKENAAAAKKLQELEDASKSELEKAVARAEAAEKQLAEVQLSKLRGDIALEAGVPADLVDFLTGGDEESLRAQAEKLAARLGGKAEQVAEKEEEAEPAQAPAAGPYAPREGDVPSDAGIDIDAIAKAARGR